MPFALIPDGYKLEKVTKAQQEAVDRFASTNATAAFLSGPASGELVKAVAIVVTPIVLAVLAKRGVAFAQEETEGLLQDTISILGGVVNEETIKKLADVIFASSGGKAFF